MNYFIPPDIIKNILDQTNIVQLIEMYIKLQKIGKNYYSICPFHNEKTPSFSINENKQYFHCFGCNAHGNIIDFLMKYNQSSFLDSIQTISNVFNIHIPYKFFNEKIQQQYCKKKKLYKIIEIASKLYYFNLQNKNSHIAQKYLKKRKINNAMIKYFQIGFAQINTLLSNPIIKKNKKYIYSLIKLGILYNNTNNTQYERFKNRIIFPIQNKYGKIIALGGRTINANNPKYINSSNTYIFNKSNILYGIYQIYQKKNKIKYILVVEGYFDVISLVQYNIKDTVSSLGTITTKNQIKVLFQKTDNIIYCYDGDVAGIKAAWRTLKIALSYLINYRSIKFIFLPQGEDPDSIIHKEGTKKFKKRIKNSVNIFDFFLMNIINQKNKIDSIYKKIQLIKKAIPLINKIPDKFIRMHLKKKLGIQIGIIDHYELNKLFQEKKYYHYNILDIKPTNMRILISLILQKPNLHQIIPCSIYEFKKMHIPGLSLFMEIFSLCKQYNHINTGQILEFYRTKKKKLNIINKLASWNNMIDTKKKKIVFIHLIKKIYQIALEKKYNTLIHKDRYYGLNITEKKILWKINQQLSKKSHI
ncbi:DNA primase [Buchnera aphidicola (Pterocallis alni)]|uniref:DNA primase n=1 Tax=Buchnera aphidicola TaxID=9 RepID=UPI0034646E41